MAYTTIDDPSAYFQTTLYTGNGSTNAITNSGNSDLQPDWVWIKKRSATENHALYDSVRGTTKTLYSNLTEAEYTESTSLTAFGSDGFTLGADGIVNANTGTYVSWNWKANGSGSANTAGSINTTATSANTTAGFSISTYTGNNTSGATIGHGLGVKPNVIIIKQRNAGSSYWIVYHDKVSSAPETDYLALNSSDAVADADVFWNDTAPTSTLITLGNDSWVNGSSTTHVCYAFAEKQGYSKFGSYVGNGQSDGQRIITGFKPACIIIKGAVSGAGDAAQNWEIYDNKRLGYNVDNNNLNPNTSGAESTGDRLDIVSNGFKIRVNSDGVNDNGSTYIYMAFAENPFVTSSGVPATAR